MFEFFVFDPFFLWSIGVKVDFFRGRVHGYSHNIWSVTCVRIIGYGVIKLGGKCGMLH